MSNDTDEKNHSFLRQINGIEEYVGMKTIWVVSINERIMLLHATAENIGKLIFD